MRLPSPKSRTVRRAAAVLLVSLGLAGGGCAGREPNLFDEIGNPPSPGSPSFSDYGPTPRPTAIYRMQTPPIQRASARIPEGAEPQVRIAAS